jgi:hypothetical protein
MFSREMFAREVKCFSGIEVWGLMAKLVNVRVESVKQAGVIETRTWSAHERVAVRRG